MLTDTQIDTLKSIIEANQILKDHVNKGRDAIAAQLATSLFPPEVTLGCVYTELGVIAASADPALADAALLKLETAAQTNTLLARMLKWLKPESSRGLDFGHPAMQAAVTGYAQAGFLTTSERDFLLNLGKRPVIVDPSDIARCR